MLDSDRALVAASANAMKELAKLASQGFAREKELRTQRLAYELWEKAGRPYGRDAEFWDRAEVILGYK